MKDLATVPYHKMSEQIVEILCQRTQNTSPEFFRLLTAFHLSKCGSMMHVKVHSPIMGIIPVNMYAINLAPSGMGKGYSTNIMEDEVIDTFKTVFTEQTFPVITEENLSALAVKRAGIKGEDPDAELVLVQKEFEELGEMLFAFDSGTPAAVKQAHHKILMGRIGSMNFEMDEIGSNLTGNADTLSTMLELFDVGKVKKKLTKNGRDNKRNADLDGRAELLCLQLDGTRLPLVERLRLTQKQPTEAEWSAGLTAMRRTMLAESDARIVLGGRVDEYKGSMPGIAEEALMSLQGKQPLYLIGGFGGCTRDIAETVGLAQPWTRSHVTWQGRTEFARFSSDDLNNGLSAKENQTLAMTSHVDQAIMLVLRGLTRVARQSD